MRWRDLRPGDMFHVPSTSRDGDVADKLYLVVDVKSRHEAMTLTVLFPTGETTEWMGRSSVRYYDDVLLSRLDG